MPARGIKEEHCRDQDCARVLIALGKGRDRKKEEN
jgi:hypothetical protein